MKGNSEKQQIQQTYYNNMKSTLWNFYTRAPFNGSFFTGLRYPGIPHLAGNFVLGKASDFITGDKLFAHWLKASTLAAQHPSGMCYFWVANQMVLVLARPEDIHEALMTNRSKITRGVATLFETVLGPSIFSASVDSWDKKRKIYHASMFMQPKLDAYEHIMQKTLQEYISDIQKNNNQKLKLNELFGNYAATNILRCVLLKNASDEQLSLFRNYIADFKSEFPKVRAALLKKIIPLKLGQLIFWNAPNLDELKQKKQLQLKQIYARTDDLTEDNIGDFIKSIASIRENTDAIHEQKEKTFENLADNLDVLGDTNALILAAEDTTSIVLEFTIKLLCKYPKVETKLRRLLNEHLLESGIFNITMQNVAKVKYLDFIINEVLRLYPPAPIVRQKITEPFTLNGVPLDKGDDIAIVSYALHRDKRIWGDDANEFIPERFADESKIPSGAFMSFSIGKFQCVGRKFAIQQVKLLLAAIYCNFKVEIENNDFNVNIEQFTLRPKLATEARFIAINPGPEPAYVSKVLNL